MKKSLLTLASVLAFTAATSQEISDALRYAQENVNGTARFRAMAGAFGALGGDFSAINVNPAGGAIFSNNQVAMTLSSYNTKNKSNYFGTNITEHDNTFDLNQAGGIFVFNNHGEKSNWKKFTLAMNYENVNDFDNTVFSAGINPNNSVDQYFLSYANQNGGAPLSLLQNSYYETLNFADAQAFLGYQGFIINPEANDPANTSYNSNVPNGGNYYQENSFVSTGYNGKITVNLASQFQNWLFIGLNTNFYGTNYWQSTSFYEQNSNDPANGVQRLRFNNNLYTYGSGFSFDLGAIAKVTDEFRAGLSYKSPTWYNLNDEFSQYLSVVHVDETNSTITTVVDPNVIIFYDDYDLRRPSKFTGSLAYIFGKQGLLSVDYTTIDYGNTDFSPEHEFANVNNAISRTLDRAGELRIGAEYRIKMLSLRAGYRWEESPYKDTNVMGNLTGYSGGLGFNFGNTKLDLAYSFSKRDLHQGFFTQGFTDGANIRSVTNNVSLTMIFEL
jgi:hypothetical protein